MVESNLGFNWSSIYSKGGVLIGKTIVEELMDYLGNPAYVADIGFDYDGRWQPVPEEQLLNYLRPDGSILLPIIMGQLGVEESVEGNFCAFVLHIEDMFCLARISLHTIARVFPFFRFNLVRNMEEDNKLQTFTLQMQLPAPNLEVAKRVADEAQRLIDIYGYYNFLNLVEFMKQNPSMVQMGLSLINKNNAVWKK
jgi:hypothetical protein